jgi:helicase MOV-10
LFKHSHRGRYVDRVDIVFEDVTLKQRFVIVRPLSAIVGSRADHELLKPTAPYVARKRTKREPEIEVVPGEPPESDKAIPWVIRLPESPIPTSLASTLSKGSFTEIMRAVRSVILPRGLERDTYNRYFKNLLWMEEHQME